MTVFGTNSEQLIALVHARLQDLHPTLFTIEDESYLHAGHAGAQGGSSHFRIKIWAPSFNGLTSVAAHRLVYHRLNDLIPYPLHAVALEIKLPK